MTDEPMPEAARLSAFEREHDQVSPPITSWDPALYAQVEQRLTVAAAEAGQDRPSRAAIDARYRAEHTVKHHRAPDMSCRTWQPRQLNPAHAAELHTLRERAHAEAAHERESRERWERETERDRGGVELEW